MARTLRIELTFLGAMQQIAGRPTLWLDLPAGATVARALALLRERMPAFVGVEPRVNVDGSDVDGRRELRAGDGLFLLPRE
jgi:hypothetical protein